MNKSIILTCLLTIARLNAVDLPFSYIVSSHESRFFYVMDENGSGVCYEAVSADNLKKYWKTNNWYSFPEELLLTSDGRFLIRVLPLISEPSDDIGSFLVFEIYDKGKLVKGYNLLELDVDTTKVLRYPRSPERKLFLGGENGAKIVKYNELIRILAEERNVHKVANEREKHSESYLLLELIDGKRYVFDLLTGEIIVTEKWLQ